VNKLISKFNLCVDQLVTIRQVHWEHVGSHIIAMKQADEDTSNASGGFTFDPFLCGTVQATLAAKLN